MDQPKDIPVCTLFNDVSEEGAQDIFSKSSQIDPSSTIKVQDHALPNEKPDSSEIRDQSESIKAEPIVCDIFQSMSSSEDLFANISVPISENKLPDHENKLENSEEKLPIHPEVTEVAVEKSMPNQSELDVTNLFGDATTAPVKLDDANIQSEALGPSKSENLTNTFNSSDLMSSILINDSLESLSNISIDPNVMTDNVISNDIASTPIVHEGDQNTPSIPLPSMARDPSLSSSPDEEKHIAEQDVLPSTTGNEAIQIVEEKLAEPIQNVTSPALNVPIKDNEIIPVESPSSSEGNTFFHDTNQSLASTALITANTGSVTLEASLQSDTNAVASVDSKQTLASSILFQNDNESSPFDTFDVKGTSDFVDDAFTSALQTSEIDRRRDAWIPNKVTEAGLANVAELQKRVKLEAQFLSRPGLATSEFLGDPLKEVFARHKGTVNINERQTLSYSAVSHDKEGLQKLINSGNLRSAVNLCALKLSHLGQGFGCATQESEHSPESLQWWNARIALLLRLQEYDIVAAELEHFRSFDTSDLYFGFYPDLYPGRKGTMVPFSLRLLHAQFPSHVNKPNQSLARLYNMLAICKQILSNLEAGLAEDGSNVELKPSDKKSSLHLWLNRKIKVLYCICNTLLQLKEYHNAIKVLETILTINPENAVYIHSAIGRILLELGDLRAATDSFDLVKLISDNSPKSTVQYLFDMGLLHLCDSNWKEALNAFNTILKYEPTNIVALNNKSVCLLYMCRLKEAISVQEETVRLKQQSPPLDHLTEEILLEGSISNLMTLYDLETSKGLLKKQAVLKHVAKHRGDGFNVTCLKM